MERFIKNVLKSERLHIVAKETGKAFALGTALGVLTGAFLGPRAGMAVGALVATTYGVSRIVPVKEFLAILTVAEKIALSNMIPGAGLLIEIVSLLSTLARKHNMKIIYFTVMTVMFIHHIEYPQEESILEPQGFTDISNVFIIILLSCSISGIIASFLLILGLYRDQKILLIPWIFTITIFTVVDLIYCTYMFVGGAEFNPMTAILFTLDFFLSSLNVYALLCVISQYQEYKAGRGTVDDELQNRVPSVHYSAPTTTTYLSTKRTVAYQEPRPSPTQSPTGAHTSLATEEPSPNPRPARKHVQFPDQGEPPGATPPSAIQQQQQQQQPQPPPHQPAEPWTISAKAGAFRGAERTPLTLCLPD